MFERLDTGARKNEAALKSMQQVQDTIRLLKQSGTVRNTKMVVKNLIEPTIGSEEEDPLLIERRENIQKQNDGLKSSGNNIGMTKVSKLIIHPNTQLNIDRKAEKMH